MLKTKISLLNRNFGLVNKYWLAVIMLMTIITTMQAKPLKIKGFTRKSCGRDLVERVEHICQSRGGHMTYTKARRIRRGIVNECCANECTDHHIYAYCSNSKSDVKSTESNSMSSETPYQLNVDLEAFESRIPEPQALTRTMDNENSIEQTTQHITTTTTSTEIPTTDHHYDVEVNKHFDSITLNRLLSSLPYNPNEFEVGTLPPEYRLAPFIPSRTRIMY